MQGAWVRSLVEELRSPVLHGAAKKKKKEAVAMVHQEWDLELQTYSGGGVPLDKLQGEAQGSRGGTVAGAEQAEGSRPHLHRRLKSHRAASRFNWRRWWVRCPKVRGTHPKPGQETALKCHILLVVQLLSRVRFFATPWTAARQASLSFTNSRSLLKLMSIELVMPSNHLILFSSCLQSFPASGSFPMSWLFASGGQSIGASASVPPMNIQDWSPLGWTSWISLQSKGLSRVFSSTTIQKHQSFSAQPSLWSDSHIHT